MQNDAELFNRLFSGGNYSLPFLIELTHPQMETLRFVNDTRDWEFDEHVFYACGFEYTPPGSDGMGGELSISAVDNQLLEFIENSDDRWALRVAGVLADGEVQPIRNYIHFHGTVSYSENMTIDFQLDGDDRLDMTFPPYKYDTDNNRGNA